MDHSVLNQNLPQPLCLRTLYCCALCLGLFAPANLVGQFQDSFESLKNNWVLHQTDGQVVTTQHIKDKEIFHHGKQSEHLQLVSGPATYIHYRYQTPTITLIDEIKPSVWIRASRKHLQFIAQVALPRTINPQTGRPLEVLIHGDTYTASGRWQQLTIPKIRTVLHSMVPSLRSQYGSQVDPRQAYIQAVIINAYSTSGPVHIWLDSFQMQTPSVGTRPHSIQPVNFQDPGLSVQSDPGNIEPPPVETRESVLLVNGSPFMPRIIEHNGESLEFLQQLGFNTISLKQFPTRQQLETAYRLGLKLIAPPNLDTGLSPTADTRSLLVWNLGQSTNQKSLTAIHEASQFVDRMPATLHRPSLVTSSDHFKQVSRYADMVILNWQPLFSSLTLEQSSQQVLQAVNELRRGTPFWLSIPTQIPPAVLQQQISLVQSQLPDHSAFQPTTTISFDRLALMAHYALATGARGLYFQSSSRLDRNDQNSMLRIRILERLNRELQLIEPWVSGGISTGMVNAGLDKHTVYMCQTDRTRLVWIFNKTDHEQIVSLPANEELLSFDVPGVPVTYLPYQISNAALHRIRNHRGANHRIALTPDAPYCLVIMTADPLVRDYIQRRIYANRKRILQLTYDMLQIELPLIRKLTWLEAHTNTELTTIFTRTESILRKSRQPVADNQWDIAYQQLTAAENGIRELQFQSWLIAQRFFDSTVSNPLALSPVALPECIATARQFQQSQWSANLLGGSSMENLQRMRQAGWQHHRHPDHPVNSLVELTPHFPREGQHCLRIQTWQPEGQSPASLLSAPVWITSPVISVKKGDLLRIHGWINIPKRLQHQGDGLVIYDSITGTPLADRFHHTTGWQPFTLFRVASEDGPMHLSIALMGLGEANIDNISIQKQLTSTPSVPSSPVETDAGLIQNVNASGFPNSPR